MDRYTDLTQDVTLWDMRMVAAELGVQYQTVKTWRKDGGWPKRGDPPRPNLLPPPDEILSGKPIWKAGTIRRWAMQTGRMTPAGAAQKRKPPGRPKAKAA